MSELQARMLIATQQMTATLIGAATDAPALYGNTQSEVVRPLLAWTICVPMASAIGAWATTPGELARTAHLLENCVPHVIR